MILLAQCAQIQKLVKAPPLQPSVLLVLVPIIARVSLFLFLFTFQLILSSLTFELPRTHVFSALGARSLGQAVFSMCWRVYWVVAKFPHSSILPIANSLDLPPQVS